MSLARGSIYRDGKRWMVALDYGIDPATGNRKRRRRVAKNNADARRILNEMVIERDRHQVTPDRLSLGDLLEAWIERGAPAVRSNRGVKSPATVENVRSLLASHCAGLAKAPLAAITVEMVEDALSASPSSRSTLVRVRSYLGQAFDFAQARRWVDWNPARLAIVPTAATEPKEPTPLTADEVRRVLVAAPQHRTGAWIVLAAMLGLRPAEIRGLEWPSIDIDSGLLVVHQQVVRSGGEWLLKPTKTGRTTTLRIPEVAVEALREHRAAQNRERMLVGTLWPAKWRDLAFRSSAGTPMDAANMRRLCRTIANEADVPTFTPYTLRHSFVTALADHGVPADVLAGQLGHADTRMVDKHYRHRITPVLEAAAEHAEDAYGIG